MIVSVIGGGSWGSAFACHLGRKNIHTRLWIKEKDVFEQAVRFRENKTFLPGSIFPPSVSFHNDLDQSVRDAEIVFTAVPSKFCRSLYTRLAPLWDPGTPLVSLTKGIEITTLKRMSEVMEDVFSPRTALKIAALSGPSFAREVADSHPTAVVVASRDQALAKKVQHIVSNSYFRAYTSDDIIGVELSGALKNVIAISAGISDGLQFGTNTVAADGFFATIGNATTGLRWSTGPGG